MELKNSKAIFFLSSIWVLTILAIALWWVYLFFNFETHALGFDQSRFTNMIKWEGSVFIVLLTTTSVLLLFYIKRDQKKVLAMQTFFASLTHELKTPLASVRLQAEVIHDLCDESKAVPYVKRLVEDVTKLENHMDKVLQLSRVERDGNLNLCKVNLISFIENISRETLFKININKIQDVYISADEFALKLIFRNLIENSKNHSNKEEAELKIETSQTTVSLSYKDHGSYNGQIEKLGTLFYKHQSSKGSGIGLYLIKKLMKKMQGELKIEIDQTKELNFKLDFKIA